MIIRQNLPTVRHNRTYQNHHNHVEPGAINTYSRKIAAAITLLVLTYKDPQPEYHFPISPTLSTACNDLLEAFDQAKGTNVVIEEDPQVDEDPKVDDDRDERHMVQDEEEFMVHSDQPRDDDDPDPGPLPDSPELPTKNRTLKPPKYCPIIQPKLHQLLFETYSELPSGENKGQFYSYLMRYLVLSSIGPKAEWKQSSVITQAFSALLFGARLVMFAHMDKNLEETKEGTYHT